MARAGRSAYAEAMHEVSVISRRLHTQLANDLLQDLLARTGEAKGQCPDCRAYSWDGEPPRLHVRGCPGKTEN